MAALRAGICALSGSIRLHKYAYSKVNGYGVLLADNLSTTRQVYRSTDLQRAIAASSRPELGLPITLGPQLRIQY